MPSHLVTYGIDKGTGELRDIKNVSRGLACNCVCPRCGCDLEAHKGNVRRHHFKHSSLEECKGAFESQLHLLSKAIIEEHKTLMLPQYVGLYCGFPQKQQFFSEVIKESAQEDLKPDCLCKYLDKQGNERTLWVEILYSHAVDEEKARKIKERHIACVEIDVSQLFKDAQVIDKDILTDFLINRSDERKWINNPQGDEMVMEEARKICEQGGILNFLIENSDDESRLWIFCSVVYYLFSVSYQLSQKEYDILCNTIKWDYESKDFVSQRRYISALQILLCQYVAIGGYKVEKLSQKEILKAICFDRNGMKENLSFFVKKVLDMNRSRRIKVYRRPRYRRGWRF